MLALVADSHGALDRLEKILETCSKNGWAMAHAGDGVVNGLAELLEKFPDVPLWYAQGNADMDEAFIAKVSKLSHVTLQKVVFFEYEGQVFGVSHFEGEAEKTFHDKKIDVWLHGHTHRAKAERNSDGSVVINPGALYEDGKYILWNPKEGKGERVFFNVS